MSAPQPPASGAGPSTASLGWDDVVARAPNLTRHLRLVRSKDAGPFTLTTDLFCHDADAYARVCAVGVLEPAWWAQVCGVDPAVVEVHPVEAIHAIKVSFPRDVVSGDLRDRDITGGQQYGAVVAALALTALGDP